MEIYPVIDPYAIHYDTFAGDVYTLDTASIILTGGEINFRDTDISIGSTLADGVLDMSADGSIRMFYDNADVGDAVDGQSFYVYRRAEEGDGYIRAYVDNANHAQIYSDRNLYLESAGAVRLKAGSNAQVILGDAIGNTKFEIYDSGSAQKASIDSDGNFQCDGDVTIGDGTAATRSITFDIDGNDGIFGYNHTDEKFEINGKRLDIGVGVFEGKGFEGDGDPDTKINFITDVFYFTAGGVEMARFQEIGIGGTDVILNIDNHANFDFIVEGAADASLLFVDGSADRVGIGTSTPDTKLQVIGDSRFGGTANYSEFEADGTLEFNGDATVWDDIRIVPGSISRPGVSDPAFIAYDVNGGGTNTYLLEFAKNDIASFTVQIPHSYKEASNISIHLHWTAGPNGAGESGNMVGWKVEYSWANIDATFGNMTSADLSDATTGTDHTHQMTPAVSITGTGKTISSMLLCNVTRTDTGADDTWAGAGAGNLPMLLEVDFHFEKNTVGSRTISAK